MVTEFIFLFSLFLTGSLWTAVIKRFSLFEKISLSILIGASLLPFLFFIFNWIFHIPVIHNPLFTWTYFTILICVFVFFLFRQGYPFTSPIRIRISRFEMLFSSLMIVSLFIFAQHIVNYVQQPLFGWDEFSYWVYAGKALFYTNGSHLAMINDQYASYPLGFPYLIAWQFQISGISIYHAKLISPLLSLIFMVNVYTVLRRLNFTTSNALLTLTIIVWGTTNYFWYNVVAYGEMIYVTTFALAVLYATAYMHTKLNSDLYTFGLLLGLSGFLRVDAVYTAMITFTLFVLFNLHLLKRFKNMLLTLMLSIIPSLVWLYFKHQNHIQAGWSTRLSFSEIRYRLHNPFFHQVLHAFLSKLDDVHVYPIVLCFYVGLLVSLAYRKREVFFLMSLCVSQISYLFFAYITVFSRFEALHVSSMDRYLLRIEPLIAFMIAFILTRSAKRKSSYI